MKIGIIGAGQIGGTLTRRWRALAHEVHVANSRDPSTLASLVTETGAVAVEAKDAPRGADLVIVTIPERNVPTLHAATCQSRYVLRAFEEQILQHHSIVMRLVM